MWAVCSPQYPPRTAPHQHFTSTPPNISLTLRAALANIMGFLDASQHSLCDISYTIPTDAFEAFLESCRLAMTRVIPPHGVVFDNALSIETQEAQNQNSYVYR